MFAFPLSFLPPPSPLPLPSSWREPLSGIPCIPNCGTWLFARAWESFAGMDQTEYLVLWIPREEPGNLDSGLEGISGDSQDEQSLEACVHLEQEQKEVTEGNLS